MKNIKPCDELCAECGFNYGSEVGVLKESMGLVSIVEQGQIFPCHMVLESVTGSMNTGVHEYAEEKDTFKVCRGYVESMFVSNMHMDNPLWLDLYAKLDGRIHKDIMTIEETRKYHGGQ